MAYRLLVADGEPVTRAGLAVFFDTSEFRLAAETDSVSELVRLTAAETFDAVVTETAFADGSGFDAVAGIRRAGYPGRILFFSASLAETSYVRALAAGGDSYLLKTAAPGDLLRTVRSLATLPPRSPQERLSRFAGELTRFAEEPPVRTPSPFPLTKRQIQVLRCIASGLGNKEIASLLSIKSDTVKEHVRNILRAVDAKDRTAAAVWAIRSGLIS